MITDMVSALRQLGVKLVLLPPGGIPLKRSKG